ncbi:YPDG domain-containing protein [Corynebacterium afermentans]|uniref:Rib/alpha-like domain-containing protein n=1 Tax=Corynebacterium afermentans TaxID=38286 RepID=UPI002573D0C5|nr:Rib/alpha-like domain-containing protein [Corynebacterium afermentans]MCG7273863.1 YPDG domain-containing protein [Corynebacterium afermentans]
MTGKHDRAFARRRGTSVAACALGLSLVVTGVQPVAAPQTASQAAAQLLDRTEADKSLVSYLGTTAVRYGETTSVSPNTNELTVHPPSSYKLVDGVNPGWGAEVDPETGELSITPDPNAELPETDTIHVEFTFDDESTKVVDAEISLEPAPVYVDQSDKVYWTGKEINLVDIRVNRAAYASKLEIDESTLPEGITATPRNFGNIKHIFLKGTPTKTGTFTVKTQLVEGGSVVVGANGPLEQTFTITVKDSADLPAPVEEHIVEDPAPVKPGESVDIDIPTENASSVEVTDLAEGLTYDSENSKITGKPKASGKAKVDIITNDAKVITDTIDIQVEESGGSTTPATTTPEDSTPEPTTTTEQTTDATTPAIPTSDRPTTQPEPTTKPSTPGSSEPSTSQPTSPTPTSDRLTTQPAPTTSAQPTTTKPTTAKPAPSVDDFAWDELTVQAGTTKVAVPARKPSQTVNVSVEGDAPEWLSVASDGQVVAEPGRDVEPRAYPVDVVSEAGERYTITVEVTAPVSDADRISDEEYKDTYVQAGKTNSSRTPIASVDRDGIEYKGQPLPAGTKFSTESHEGTVDKDTGVVTVKAPLRTPAGETITIPVDFTYPDGTKGKADAVFHVDAGAQNEAYKPAYQEGLGAQPGKTVVVPLLDGTFPVNKDGENIGQYALAPVYDDKGNELGTAKAYKGWDVSIDPDTGAIYAAAPEENPEPIEVPVRVLYSDGTVSDKDGEPTVFAHIAALTGPSLADSTEAAGYGKPFFDADGNIRMFPTGSMPPGATFEQTGLTALPVEIDPETGAITVKVSEDAPVGANFDIPLKLTLPDGSVQEITVPVATQSEAASQVVSWRPVQVTEAGTPVTVAPSQAPAGATYALAASFDADGWQASVDPTTGAITAARNGDEEDPQATLIPVVVTFADGSQRVVEVPATTVRGTAALTRVEYPRVTINAGQIAILRPNVAGASFSLIKPIPGLRTKVDPETGELTVASYDGTVPGPRDIPVQVTFEDSSHTITSARVEVRTKTGKGTLAESISLNDVSAVGRPDTTTQVTLPVPRAAAEHPFTLGEFDADGWEVSLDRTRGVLDIHVPASATGQVKEIPVNVLLADGSTTQLKVAVEVDGVVAGGSSQSESGSSKPSPWVWALAVLGLLGAAGKVLYDNRDNFQHFLERWM